MREVLLHGAQDDWVTELGNKSVASLNTFLRCSAVIGLNTFLKECIQACIIYIVCYGVCDY